MHSRMPFWNNTHNVRLGRELCFLQRFERHPSDRQRAILVLYSVVVVTEDVSRQAKVCNLHIQLLVDPEIRTYHFVAATTHDVSFVALGYVLETRIFVYGLM